MIGSWGVLNGAMLAGLLAAAVPVIIHLLTRRRVPVVEWGAMRFLDVGRRARQRIHWSELLLMLSRIGLLAAVALALARPYLTPGVSAEGAGASPADALGASSRGSARDVVIIIDGSASMARAHAGATRLAEAARHARRFVAALGPGDSVGLLVAGDRVRPLVDPPVFDKTKALAALDTLAQAAPRGSSDLPAALAEAFRLLERGRNPERDVVILGDAQRAAWRPGDVARWTLLRDLARRLPVPPRIWSASLAGEHLDPDDPPDGALGQPVLSRAIATPGLPLTITANLLNAGPGPLTRGVELLLDGHRVPGASQSIGPIPPGASAPVVFQTSIASPGSHVLTVRLQGIDDPIPDNDAASVALEVAPALGVVLVDGEPSSRPFEGEVDFLRAALAPEGDASPLVRTHVVLADRLDLDTLRGQAVVVLANVERIPPELAAALARFVDGGGGLLVAPGDKVDPSSYAALTWLPARLGEAVGNPAARSPVAHPDPGTFQGPALSALSRGEKPPLGQAALFGYRRLEPVSGASVVGRLDTGDPWAVERGSGKGRVLVLAGPLDAEGGTLPVNPDFVPLMHEWTLHLAGGAGPRVVNPGEPLLFDVALDPPAETVPTTLPVTTPSGSTLSAASARAGDRLRARLDDASESGVYRLALPDPPGGVAHGVVATDPREADPARLEPEEAARLASGWPDTFTLDLVDDPTRVLSRILMPSGPAARREFWRALILLALAGLCLEIYLTHRMARAGTPPLAA